MRVSVTPEGMVIDRLGGSNERILFITPPQEWSDDQS